MALKITASVRAATRKDDPTGVYVAYCPSLKLYSQGTTEERARQALNGAILLYLSTCIQHGILDKALAELGFADVSPVPTSSPKKMMEEFVAVEHYDETFEVDVPLYLLNQRDKELAVC